MVHTSDILVIGGGVIGCAIARAAAAEGMSVAVLDAGPVGREASWAAGGILTPIHCSAYPEPLLGFCAASAAGYPDWCLALREESGIDPEFARCGMLVARFAGEDEGEAGGAEGTAGAPGRPAVVLSGAEARASEPTLSPEVRSALLLPDVCQVRTPRLVRALSESAARRNVAFFPGAAARRLRVSDGRVTGADTDGAAFSAGATVLAAGAWSADLVRPLGFDLPVIPCRGQMILTSLPPGTLKRILLHGDRYLVPRADGRILAGSTVEHAGFDRSVTVEGVAALAAEAARLAPALAGRPLLASWAGLRPETPDRMPFLGRFPGIGGLIAATGHYRNGILLAPATAHAVADLLAGRPPRHAIDPFSPSRFDAPRTVG